MKTVLVTGSNSGIGFYTARRLIANGFYVYAGVRESANLDKFKRIDNIETIKLDVTVQSEIDAAEEHIQSEGRGLFGIVNNAGIQRFTKMNTFDECDLHDIMNTNVFGPLRINKTFFPMLRASGGRTIAIGSISAFQPCGGSGIYGMSKAALSSYIDSYSQEVAEFGVHAGIIEPGGYNTNILLRADRESLPDDVRENIKSRLRAFKFSGKEPHEVADAVLHMMTSDNPKRRYMIVPRERQAMKTINAVLTKLVELNSNQEYTYSKDELVNMLEKVLAEFSSE